MKFFCSLIVFIYDSTLSNYLLLAKASLVVQTVKNLSVMQETRVQSLGREDRLEKGMATHSSILAWKVLWAEEPGGLQSIRVGHDWATEHALIKYINSWEFPGGPVVRLCAFIAEGMGSKLGQELRSCKPHGMAKKKKKRKMHVCVYKYSKSQGI